MLGSRDCFRLFFKSKVARGEVEYLYCVVCETSYGKLLVAFDGLGVCYSGFVGPSLEPSLEYLGELFPNAHITMQSSVPWLDELLGLIGRVLPHRPIPLILYGTLLQQATWEALLEVSLGETITYIELATKAGYPRAVRAVASAVGKNTIVPFVPCHRVVPRSGGLGQYSAEGGVERKRKLLLLERV
ncbi:MAG: methylated-DNA--[protein]-cysteine S-methyltransferase [Porphyromonadaceae bacterium]|nr:methylated-DNA--[protein]-cysteine S-methyltransferase [Porphyromonadaceae bacterium]